MVPIATLLSRGEALVVAAKLDAAGIPVDVGGEFYTSVSPDILAIGGFRILIPIGCHDEASAILRETAEDFAPEFPHAMRSAMARLSVAWLGVTAIFALPFALVAGLQGLGFFLVAPFLLMTTPVNPAVRGDYYLSGQPS
ncbi:hypothetical protein [Sphingopyxis sp. KK2]|uniref:hypothetical protein n=1 Tax=Sphingopyxis sp. KK2 TaxID=1855727 RepID=UPI001181A707|nr:hypothetical protein [Sphingopyxis sp. KK2]